MPQRAIGVGVTLTLTYLLYRDALSAILIDVTFGGIGMLGTLACPDLAAKACPKQAAGTAFARLMSAYNGGSQGSESIGGWLYNALGCTWLIVLSATCMVLGWLLVPLVGVEQIEALAAAPNLTGERPISRPGDDHMGSEDGGDLLPCVAAPRGNMSRRGPEGPPISALSFHQKWRPRRTVVVLCSPAIGTPLSSSEDEGQASLIMREERCLSCMTCDWV